MPAKLNYWLPATTCCCYEAIAERSLQVCLILTVKSHLLCEVKTSDCVCLNHEQYALVMQPL
eukprot:18283-Heterococcus_DN1.PRE.3